MSKIVIIVHGIFHFYYDGFRNMTIGKKLWTIIFIKLFIIFIVLRIFFFPDYLNSRFTTDSQKGDFVMEQLLINNSK
ncbi:MAG TPA: DUF4492 domain-containing protein [Bacteroidales bacterium]|nr:DUF4492 domain-containing protein [Bacteroidales bacterium]